MMRILFFGSLCLLFVSVLRFLPDAQAATTSHYVSPNGSGSSCTRQTPCSLDTGLSKAQAGDEVVLLDGTYYSTLFTRRSGVTIRAGNTHKAIVTPPLTGWNAGQEGVSQGDGAYVRVYHANTTVRGMVFDGNGRRTYRVLHIHNADNAIFEHNILRSSEGDMVSCGVANNVIFRHNLVEDSNTEGMYCGGNTANPPGPQNWQIYGNTFRQIGKLRNSTSIEMKPSSRNADIHHNIVENQARGADGCLIIVSVGHRFHDNIIRNTPCGTGVIRLNPWTGSQIYNNVIHHATSGITLEYTLQSQTNTPNKVNIFGNTFCSLNNYRAQPRAGHEGAEAGVNFHDNNGIPGSGVPQTVCDAEVKRILGEMKNLAGADTSQLPQQLRPPLLSLSHSNLVGP